MISRLIETLDRAIVDCEDPMRGDCLRAERAAALARQGQMADARFALRGLRARSQYRRHPELQAWVHLVQGQIEHFESLAPSAREQFRLARECAAKAGQARVQALAAAWLANCAYNLRDFDEMAECLIEALRLAPPDDHTAQTRICLVRADASRLAGLNERSLRLFVDVRHHAVALGDTAMVAAMMHNRASGQTDQLDLFDALGDSRREEARLVLIEADSSGSLDRGLGNASLGAMTPLMRARLYLVLGRWDEALALFDAHLDRARREGMAYLAPHLVINAAWCEWQLGRPEAALQRIATVEAEVDHQQDPDDRAASHARLSRLFQAQGQEERARWHEEQAQRACSEYRAMQTRLAEALARVDRAQPA